MIHSTRSHLTAAVLVAAIALAATSTFGQGITIDLGKTEAGRYMNLVGNTAGSDGEITSNIVIGSEYAARNKGTSMYFNIDDSCFYKLPAGWFVLVNVEYYDAPGVEIKLVYDAASNHAGKEHAQSITTTGSNTWKAKSFTIGDAWFGNGLAHGADFKLVAASGAMTINAVSVIPFEAFYDYGSVTDSASMTWTWNGGGDSHTQIVTKDGEECVGTIGTDQYLCMDVDESFLWGGKPTSNIFLTIEYYDADPTLGFRLQYDAVGNIFQRTPFVYGKGWGSFRTFTFEIPDAYFMNRQSPLYDFRLHIPTSGLAINRILIARLPKKPLPPNNIANFTAYKALETPAADGALAEWNWLTPCAVVQQYNPDATRSDEFYRTWLQNSANVPVAEPGETGVSDPGVPGSWDPRDLSGGVRVQWDDQNLYFCVNVKDNIVNTTGATWENKDGFGFFIDVAHTYNAAGIAPVAIKDNSTFQQGEHFFFFPAEQGQPGIWRHSTSQDGEALPAGVTRTVVKTDSGYTIEASVPLSLIADGLTWRPGVSGDKDAFNPLFAWLINDNDGVSASSGRVMYGGHNDDDEFWGTLNMNPTPLLDKGISVNFGSPNYENLVAQVETSGDGAVDIVSKEGKRAALLKNGYVYLAVNDTAIGLVKHPRVTIAVEYFDSDDAGQFNIQYDGAAGAYTDTKFVTPGDTKTWKTAFFDISDAKFANRQNGGADVRVHCTTNNLYVNEVRIAVADLWIDLGTESTGWGITPSNLGYDGARMATTVGGVDCITNDRATAANASYFYHQIADSLIYNGSHKDVWVTIVYYDTVSTGAIGLNYDGVTNTWSNAIGNVFILGSNQWKLHTFHLDDARFRNLENGQSDFRIALQGGTAMFVNRIMIGSHDGIATPLGVKPESAAPSVFALEQNYPNPFNPATTISFSLPSRSFVSLKVFDVMGRDVATIVSEQLSAGNYARQWTAAGMPSGIYFYRLQAGASTVTMKACLLK